jgi:hypothetical protein
MMPDVKVEGIDNLITTETKLSLPEVMAECGRRMGIPVPLTLLAMPLACATIVLERWTCDIFYAFEGSVLEHERLHCRGYWHDDGLREYRDSYRSNLERDL